jgi:hypothetical protein
MYKCIFGDISTLAPESMYLKFRMYHVRRYWCLGNTRWRACFAARGSLSSSKAAVAQPSPHDGLSVGTAATQVLSGL